MERWIKIHTKLLNWEWVQCPETLALWIHLLIRAKTEDTNWQGITIPRGSLIATRKELAKWTGLSEQQVRTSITRLISTNEITSTSTNKFTIITISKYDSYQLEESESNQDINQQINQRTTNEQPTNNQQADFPIDSLFNQSFSSYQSTNQEKISLKEKYQKKAPLTKKVDEISGAAKTVTCKKIFPDLSMVKEELLNIFTEYIQMRKAIKHPIKTQNTINQRYEKLMKLSGGDTELASKIVKQSIDNEWRDFFPLKDDNPQKPQPKQKQEYSNEKYW